MAIKKMLFWLVVGFSLAFLMMTIFAQTPRPDPRRTILEICAVTHLLPNETCPLAIIILPPGRMPIGIPVCPIEHEYQPKRRPKR